MHPVCFKLFGLTISWFGVMLAAGFFAGLASWVWLGKKEGRDLNFCSDLLFWIMVSGIVGARVAYVLSEAGFYMANPAKILAVNEGGLIYYGGFLGAGLAILVFSRVKHVGIWSLFDFVITSLPLAHVFGRIGCFLNGCCFGKIHNGVAAVTYPVNSSCGWEQYDGHLITNSVVQPLMSALRHWRVTDQEFHQKLTGFLNSGAITQADTRTLPVYPVQLYEAGLNLLLYFVLLWIYRRNKKAGLVTALYMLAYPTARFLLEFIRGDERVPWFLGFDVAQTISMGFFVVGLVLLAGSLSGKLGERQKEVEIVDTGSPRK